MSTWPGGGRGAWFAAAAGGKAVGLSTARLDVDGGCQVDGFTLRSHLDGWDGLMEAAIGWAEASGARGVQGLVSDEDAEKRALFEALGFTGTGCGRPFDLDGRRVGSEVLTSSL